MPERHPIGVYGTLKRGYPNHHLLKRRIVNEEPRMATLPEFAMFGAGRFPFIKRWPGADMVVHLELYDIKEDMFEHTVTLLDRLEGYEEGRLHNHYRRELLTVILEDGAETQAWLYTGDPSEHEQTGYMFDQDDSEHEAVWPLLPGGVWTPDTERLAWLTDDGWAGTRASRIGTFAHPAPSATYFEEKL